MKKQDSKWDISNQSERDKNFHSHTHIANSALFNSHLCTSTLQQQQNGYSSITNHSFIHNNHTTDYLMHIMISEFSDQLGFIFSQQITVPSQIPLPLSTSTHRSSTIYRSLTIFHPSTCWPRTNLCLASESIQNTLSNSSECISGCRSPGTLLDVLISAMSTTHLILMKTIRHGNPYASRGVVI